MSDVLSTLSPYERAIAAVNYEDYMEKGFFKLETLLLYLANDVINLIKEVDKK